MNISQLSSFQCLTEDGKELTRVCLIDFHSGLVVYDQLVKPAKPVIDYLTRSFYLVFDLNKQFTDQQMVRNNSSSSCSRHHYSRRSSNTHPAFTISAPHQPFRFLPTSTTTTDADTTRSLPRIRPQRTQNLPPLLYRHRLNIPPPPWTATQTWSRLAHSKMVRAGNPNPRRRRARPRRRRAGVLGAVEEKDERRSWVWRVQDGFGVDF